MREEGSGLNKVKAAEGGAGGTGVGGERREEFLVAATAAKAHSKRAHLKPWVYQQSYNSFSSQNGRTTVRRQNIW